MQQIIIDTNLLLDDPKILNKLNKNYEKIIILTTVLKELDKLKYEPDTSYSARNAIYAILEFKEKYPDNIEFIIKDENVSINDMHIIKDTIEASADLATKDISMSLIAEAKGIHTLLYDVIVNNIFDPYIRMSVDEIFDASPSFCFEQKYQGKEYNDIVRHIEKLNTDAWMFLFISGVEELGILYANNPITHVLERIDNIPTYRFLGEEKIVLKALDLYQICAFYVFENAPNVLLTGKWGSGKTLLGTAYAISKSKRKTFITRPPIGINKKYDLGFMPGPQPLDAKVLTPTGWTTVGEINPGDFVIGVDGKKAKVLKTFDKGIKSIYKIETTNGGVTKACGDHIWATKNHNELKHNKAFKLRSTLEIKNTLYNPNKGPVYNHNLPQNDVVEFDCNEELPIPPYTLGVILGDGSISNSISFTSKDEDIVKRVEREINQYDLHLLRCGIQYTIVGNYINNKPSKPVKIVNIFNREVVIYSSVSVAAKAIKTNKTTINSRCIKNLIINNYEYSFLKADRWRNYIKNILYVLGLSGTKANTKFIPSIYKYTSVENRVAILQGLMDTDGTIKGSTGGQCLTTTSKRLAEDVIELARSLGINAVFYTRDRVGNVNKKSIGGNIISKHISYEVTIPKSNVFNVFYLKRKSMKISPVNKKTHIKIKNIEYCGEAEAKCILIDNDSHLYITDDYIITHNTKEDKMIDWFAGFFSALYFLYANTRGQDGGKGIEYDYVKDKIFKDRFETIPLNAIQGLSLLESDTMIVDEIQLIDIDYLSMIISRSSNGSKLILLGDLAQTYGVVRPSESGLLKLLRLLPHKYLAYVRLENSHRNGLISLADKLQDRVIN